MLKKLAVSGQKVDGQKVDGQMVDGQKVDGQKVDGQKVDICTMDKRSIYLNIDYIFYVISVA